MGTGALPPSQDLVGQIAPPSRGLSFPTCQMMVTILHLPHRGGCEAAAPGGSRRGDWEGPPVSRELLQPKPAPLPSPRARLLRRVPGPLPSVVRLRGPLDLVVLSSSSLPLCKPRRPGPRACPPVPDTRKTATKTPRGPGPPNPAGAQGWGLVAVVCVVLESLSASVL